MMELHISESFGGGSGVPARSHTMALSRSLRARMPSMTSANASDGSANSRAIRRFCHAGRAGSSRKVSMAVRNARSRSLRRPHRRRHQAFQRLAVHLAQHAGVEFSLVAEIIIDRREVDPGALGDLAHGGRAEALFGEHLARRVQQTLTQLAALRDCPWCGPFRNLTIS